MAIRTSSNSDYQTYKRPSITLGNTQVSLNHSLYNHIISVAQRANAPIELAMSSVLSAMGFAVQHHVKVKLPYGKSVPVALFTLTIAPSGSGKSSVTDLVWKVPRALMDKFAPNDEILNEYKAEQSWWQTRLKKLEKAVANAASVNDPSVQELNNHLELKPIQPLRADWMFDDTTPEGLFHAMATGWSNVALVSAEGGSILQGRAIQHLPPINQLWSGESVKINRKTQYLLMINGILSIAIMTQHNSFNDFISNNNKQARSSGFLARTLACSVDSTDCNISDRYAVSDWFDNRMTSLLTSAFEQPNQEPKLLTLSKGALDIWQNFVDQVKHTATNKQHPLHHLQDHVAKVPEITARIAGILSYFEDDLHTTSIDRDSMQTAIELMSFYLNEATRLYHPQAQEIEHAELLLAWLKKEFQKLNSNLPSKMQLNYYNLQYVYIDKSTAYHYLPKPLRSKYRLDQALEILENQGLLYQTHMNGRGVLNINISSLYPTTYMPYS